MPTYTIEIERRRCTNCGTVHNNIISAVLGSNRGAFLSPIAGHPATVEHKISHSLLPFCPTCMPETLDTETINLPFSQTDRPRTFLVDSHNHATRTYTLEDL